MSSGSLTSNLVVKAGPWDGMNRLRLGGDFPPKTPFFSLKDLGSLKFKAKVYLESSSLLLN